jgi:ribonuclease HI
VTYVAYTDGASRGNPGDAGVGVVVRDEEGRTALSLHGYIGRTTNNVAEYTALKTLLDRFRARDCTKLVVNSDSELLVRQMNGQYRVKDPGLKKLHEDARRLLPSLPFQVEIRHVPRAGNAEADRLANEGIDSRLPLPPPGSGQNV